MNEILAQKIRELPSQPGVYIMLDKDGAIIYIGKAKVLKNRVSQYFHNLNSHTPKVAAMVSNIADFRYIIVNSELDALSLEATLIKRHKPRYNILLKDDKAHPYIRIDLRQTYPTLEIVRRVKADGAKYFGPYFGGVYVKDVVELCKSAFRVRACRGNVWAKSHRVCLNYHLGLCSGPCERKIAPEAYREQLAQAIRFLNGNDDEIAAMLKARMKDAAAAEEYERALVYRDRLAMLDRLGERLVSNLGRDADFDAFGYASNGAHACVTVLIVRGGKTIAGENFPIVDASLAAGEILSSFLVQYYDGSRMLPPEIELLEIGDDRDTVREYLVTKYSRAVTLNVPERGAKKKLVENAVANARDAVTKTVDRTVRKEEMTLGAIENLQKVLNLPRAPRRMECFDISHISGTDMVASMTVFFDGEPDKKSYRRFKIKTVDGNNDFACMKETLSRRLAHLDLPDAEKFGACPDLIVIDGGKGQLKYSLEALAEHCRDIPVCSLAEKEEDVYLPGQAAPIRLPRESYELRLLQRIRDEAHRFAITFQRSLRTNHYLSQLEEIPGVGKERRVALLDRFKTVERIKAATVEEIAATEGFGLKRAQAVFDWFRAKEKEKNPVDPDVGAGDIGDAAEEAAQHGQSVATNPRGIGREQASASTQSTEAIYNYEVDTCAEQASASTQSTEAASICESRNDAGRDAPTKRTKEAGDENNG